MISNLPMYINAIFIATTLLSIFLFYKATKKSKNTLVLLFAWIIFQAALLVNACSIILCHNHPSGNLKPSAADIKFTNKIIAAGKVIDVAVVDHIIVSHKGYTSMRKEGCCEFEGYAGK